MEEGMKEEVLEIEEEGWNEEKEVKKEEKLSVGEGEEREAGRGKGGGGVVEASLDAQLANQRVSRPLVFSPELHRKSQQQNTTGLWSK